VELVELGVFGGENLEWSCFFGSGAAWSSPKHALISFRDCVVRVCLNCQDRVLVFLHTGWSTTGASVG
jgi:hypothetical protein